MLFSSGEDSWDDERRPARRSEKLEVPGSKSRSRSRSSSHSQSKSPRRYQDYQYDSQRRSPRPERAVSSRPRASPVSKSPILDKFGRSVREEMERTRYRSRHGSSSSRKSPRLESSRKERIQDEVCYISPRRQKSSSRSPRRESPRYREEPRPDYRRYYQSQTESSEDWRDKQRVSPPPPLRKQGRNFEDVIEQEPRKVSRPSKKEYDSKWGLVAGKINKKEEKEEADFEHHDYVNYSPSRGPKIVEPEESLSPWGQKSPRERISAMEEAEDSPESVEEIIAEEEGERKESSPGGMYNIQDIMVQPTEPFVIPARETMNPMLLDLNQDSSRHLALKEDEKDSCLGLSVSDLTSDHELVKKEDFVMRVEAPPPKQWTLFSYSPDGQFQVRDEETGQIFQIFNQQPEPEPESEDSEEAGGEKEMSWCSLYLVSKIFGLALMMAGLAGMIVLALY